MSSLEGKKVSSKIKTVVWLLLLSVSFCILYDCIKKEFMPTEHEIIKTDTVFVHTSDTITHVKPTHTVIVRKDTISVPNDVVMHDTITDSVYVLLPRTQNRYETTIDNDTVVTVISGINPTLDSVMIHKTTQIISNTAIISQKKRHPFSLGVQVGFGVTSMGLSPYLGIGIGYSLLNF